MFDHVMRFLTNIKEIKIASKYFLSSASQTTPCNMQTIDIYDFTGL